MAPPHAPLPRVPGGYRTLLVDPPWAYRQKLGRGKKAGDTTRGGLPYEPMSLDEILALPVGEIAAKSSMLFLWATSSHLPEAVRVMEAWGFDYKQTGTWVKVSRSGHVHIGTGFWMRVACEFWLLGVRGNPREKFKGPHGASGLGESNVILAPRGRHSEKPVEMYRKAERLGSGPRVELFARALRPGWDSWGNEVPASGSTTDGVDW